MSNLVLRVNEAMLAILLTGGIEPGTAAWAIDALSVYVSAYTLEISLVTQRTSHQDDSWVLGLIVDNLAQRRPTPRD